MSTTQSVVGSVAVAAAANAVWFGALGMLRYRRVRAYQAWAAAHGMQYTRRDDSWLTRCAWGSPIGFGSGRRAIDVLTGTFRGRPAACFTYRYTTKRQGGGEDGGRIDRHYFGVFSLQLPHPVPELRVSKPLFGFRQPALAGTYEVVGADAAFAAQVLHPEMQQFLLTNGLGGFSMVGDRIFIRTRGRADANRIEQYWDQLVAIIERTPQNAGLR
jgi:hypothetical protein